MKMWKVFLGIGISVLVIGIVILVAGLALNGWKFDVEYEMQTFTSQEDDDKLELEISAGSVEVTYHDEENFEIIYPESYRYGYNVTEIRGKIIVSPKSHFGIWFGWNKIPAMTVKIPRGKVIDFSLHMSAGSAEVASGEFTDFKISMSAGTANVGDVKCNNFTAKLSAGTVTVKSVETDRTEVKLSAGSATFNGVKCGDITVHLSAGAVNLSVIGSKDDYNISVDKSAGSCNVGSQINVQSDKRLSVDLSAGTVNVSFTD